MASSKAVTTSCLPGAEFAGWGGVPASAGHPACMQLMWSRGEAPHGRTLLHEPAGALRRVPELHVAIVLGAVSEGRTQHPAGLSLPRCCAQQTAGQAQPAARLASVHNDKFSLWPSAKCHEICLGSDDRQSLFTQGCESIGVATCSQVCYSSLTWDTNALQT